MVMITTPSDASSYPSYYRTRRTPFMPLQEQEVVRYESEIVPAYSDHDIRIRAAHSGDQLAIDQARTDSSIDNVAIGSSSSNRREMQGRSQSGHRGVQDTTYVIEEHIPAEVYYRAGRTQFEGLLKCDNVEYRSDHDARIRGAHSEDQLYTSNALVERSSRSRRLQSSEDRALSQRSSSCQREARGPPSRALVKRSSSCSREVQRLGTHREDVQEYTRNGGPTQEYVVEEHIPAQYNYRTPSKAEVVEMEYGRRAQSVGPKRESPGQLVKIIEEPGVLYYVPLQPDEPKPLEDHRKQDYYDNRRAVFTEPKGQQLTSKQQVIYKDATSDVRQGNVSNVSDVNNDRALVPFDRSQSVPPAAAQQDYSSQWIKIPRGPATIKVYPAINSNDPTTWVYQEPLQPQTHAGHKAVDPREAYDQSKKQPKMEIVTYQHIPKRDIDSEKREIVTDQRYDRSHKDNRGLEYRPKWVKIQRGPSPFIYSSIHTLDSDACTNPALTGYVGSTNYLKEREKAKREQEKKYNDEKALLNSTVSTTKSTSAKVNRILNSREDMEKKHLLDMLFDIRHILKEREALGEYEIPLRLKNKLTYLTNTVQDLSGKSSRSRRETGSCPPEYYAKDPAKDFLKVSSMMAPIRPIHSGRSSALSQYRYMLHDPYVV